jgi:hypothetical protein
MSKTREEEALEDGASMFNVGFARRHPELVTTHVDSELIEKILMFMYDKGYVDCCKDTLERDRKCPHE